MEIIQQPQALTFVGNIPDIIVSGDVSVQLQLLQGADEIFLEEYVFDESGEVRIPLEEVINDQLAIALPDSDLFQQVNGAKEFKVVLTEGATELEIEFTAIKGGVARSNFNTLDFVKSNLLTWQPQSKQVKWFDPSYLSYYATEAVEVRAKGYFPGGTDETISLHSITEEGLWSWNMMYADIAELFASQPIFIDVWVDSVALEGGEPEFSTFTQRYVLTVEEFDYDDLFVFENSLGGIDTIRFTGEKKLVNANRFDLGVFYDRVSFEYQVNPDKAFEKNTGYFQTKNALKWSQDFFSSKQKYIDEPDGLTRILTRDPELVDIQHQLSAFDFIYIYTEQTVYLNLNRDFESTPVLVIIGPDDQEYFLNPRDFFFPTLSDPSQAVFIVRREGERTLSELPIAALLAWLLMNLSGGLDDDILDALNAAQSPSSGNPFITNSALMGILEDLDLDIDLSNYVTQQQLTDILESLNLPSGRRIISTETIITSATAGTITAEWLNDAGVTRSVTGQALTFAGAPSSGNLRWDLVELFDDGTVAVKTGTPGTTAVRPDPTANTLVAWEGIWNSDGVVQPTQPGNPNQQSVWSNVRLGTGVTANAEGLFARVWEGNLSASENYQIILAYGDPANAVEPAKGAGASILKVSWTCDASRNIVADTVLIETEGGRSLAGDFRLIQITGNKAALYHRGSHFWSRIQYRVLFQNSGIRLQDFFNGQTYGSAPSGTAYNSRNSLYFDFIPSTGNIRFDRMRKYGFTTALTGNITFSIEGGVEGTMAKIRWNAATLPTVSVVEGGVTLVREGATFKENVDNYVQAVLDKNDAGTVNRIRYTITQAQ